MNRMNKFKIIGILCIIFLLLTACATKETASEPEKITDSVEEEVKDYGVVEIENNEQVLVFHEVPQRAVSLNQHVTEIMLALGLEKHMVGTAYLDDEILPIYQEAYSKIPVLADKYPSQEVLLGVEPDFVYAGWKSAYLEDNVGTVEELDKFGVKAYLHHSSTKVGPTLDDIFLDIRHIARIFDVVERGEEVIGEMTSQIEQIKQRIPQDKEALKVFVYDSGSENAAFTVGQNFLNAIINMAGATNIFHDLEKNWAEVNWEEIVNRNPDVIIIVDYGDVSAEEKKASFLSIRLSKM